MPCSSHQGIRAVLGGQMTTGSTPTCGAYKRIVCSERSAPLTNGANVTYATLSRDEVRRMAPLARWKSHVLPGPGNRSLLLARRVPERRTALEHASAPLGPGLDETPDRRRGGALDRSTRRGRRREPHTTCRERFQDCRRRRT